MCNGDFSWNPENYVKMDFLWDVDELTFSIKCFLAFLISICTGPWRIKLRWSVYNKLPISPSVPETMETNLYKKREGGRGR